MELWQPINGIPVACGGVGFVGEDRLHGSPTDRRIVWMTMADGTRRELAWPLGYRARFAPGLELLNESGKLVGVEGSLLVGGCQTPIEGVWWVELETLGPTAAPGP